WQEWAKQRGAKGLAYVTVEQDGALGGPVAKNLSDTERDGLLRGGTLRGRRAAAHCAVARRTVNEAAGVVRDAAGQRS
ncbi:MAG TPA: Asp-tRNA(Asn)/Glu-tRNA(Gln) amidotransferase GatCAB subunit C, partial [Actinobacteria bacterium]|nr:Asp-tRNA(Asn)/Glu-tRNA(Gln) amidotransferase GatCAB subunit C [Actinomycetota bacterium]